MTPSVIRREVLRLMAATPLAAPALARAAARPRVVVVGAGILGASIAYHLARGGAQVTVVDKDSPGAGATQGAFAMLIATHADDPALNAFYGLAILDWRRLQGELGGALQIQWGGAASWAAPGKAADDLAAQTRRLRAWGSPIRPIDAAELVRLVPGVRPGDFGVGNFSPDQGTLDPTAALQALLAAGRRMGVVYRYPCKALGIAREGPAAARLMTSVGPLDADVIVLAAGAGLPDLAAQVGVKAPIDVVSGTLAHSRPFPRVLGRVLNGPAGSLKQDPDGRIVTGADYRPGANGTDVSQAYGERLLATAAGVVPALAGAKLERMTLGYVPMPADGHPIVGFCRAPANLYLALTMSGITFAPLIGRLAAMEILDALPADVLASYRPARFA